MTAADTNNLQAFRRGARARHIAVVHGRAADERGQALVEFALVLPVLVLLLFGIVQFGLALNSANDETHLANEVARYATVNENPACAEGAVECPETLQEWGEKQADSKALEDQRVCISFPEGESIGKPVVVKVSGALSSTINWLPVLKEKSIEGKAAMRLEAPPTAYKADAGC